MRTVAVSWDKEGGRFTALGRHRGQTIAINAPAEADSKRAPTGFSATELLLAGAGACSAWDVVEILRKRRHDISALDVSVDGHQDDEPPWAYRRVALHFRVAGEGLKVPVLARVVRLSIVRYCSVISTLAGVASIEATVELVAPDGKSSGRKHIELALPSSPSVESGLTAGDLPALGVAEPVVDEDEE